MIRILLCILIRNLHRIETAFLKLILECSERSVWQFEQIKHTNACTGFEETLYERETDTALPTNVEVSNTYMTFMQKLPYQ